MPRLLRYVRRHGLRDGWWLWRQQSAIEADAAVRAAASRAAPPLRIHHGDRPRLTGYRRDR